MNPIALSNEVILDIERMLKDPKLLQLLMDGKGNKWQNIQIKRDGDVIIGRYPHQWINKIFGEEYRFSFIDFVYNMVSILSKNTNNLHYNQTHSVVREEIVKMVGKAITNEQYNRLIMELYVIFYLHFSHPELLSESVDNQQKGNCNNNSISGVYIQAADGKIVFDINRNVFLRPYFT